jgi:hypothetical protein
MCEQRRDAVQGSCALPNRFAEFELFVPARQIQNAIFRAVPGQHLGEEVIQESWHRLRDCHTMADYL